MSVSGSDARALLLRYGLNQSWEQHLKNAGSALGGEDYGTPYGTPLPIVAGVVEVASPGSKYSWYNPGLGLAIAYRRPDGTRTIYAHLSDVDGVQAYSGNSGTVRPKPTPAEPHNGSHLHAHDVAANGRTRLRPFSTVPSGGGGGGIEKKDEDIPMRVLYNKDDSNDDTRRALIGELSFQVITGPQSTRERKFWGDPVNVTKGEWAAARDLVIARRKELGLPVSISGNGSVGASKADVDAAADRVIAEVPARSGAAARAAIVKP